MGFLLWLILLWRIFRIAAPVLLAVVLAGVLVWVFASGLPTLVAFLVFLFVAIEGAVVFARAFSSNKRRSD